MLAVRRAITIIEVMLFVYLCLGLILLIWDFPRAWEALPCSSPGAQADCYPWGAEGPAAEAGWGYKTKHNYIAQSVTAIAEISIGLVAAALSPKGWRIVFLAITICLVSTTNYYLPFFF